MFKTFVILFVTALAIVSANPQCAGCVSELKGEDIKGAEDALKLSLSKLAAGDGPSYELVKINSASSQVISGIKYVVNADLADGGKTKTCNVIIISQPWLENGIEVTFDCPNEQKIVKKHSA